MNISLYLLSLFSILASGLAGHRQTGDKDDKKKDKEPAVVYCAGKNPFLAGLKADGVTINESPLKDSLKCGLEWNSFGTCCNEATLITYATKDHEMIVSRSTDLRKEIEEIQEVLKPIVASADSVKSTLDKGVMSAYEAHVKRQQEREQQRQKKQEQRALAQQNTANSHGKITAAGKSSSSPAEPTSPLTKVPDERQQQKDKERLQRQIEQFMRMFSSLLQTSVAPPILEHVTIRSSQSDLPPCAAPAREDLRDTFPKVEMPRSLSLIAQTSSRSVMHLGRP